jgi:hypothetical protein
MTILSRILFASALISMLGLSVSTHTRSKKGVVKKPATPTVIAADPKPSPSPEQPVNLPGKRNERPDSAQKTGDQQATANTSKAVADPPYFYEFSQPKFIITKITIRHDENGKGSLTFYKGQYDEPITEPVQLSQATLDKITATLTALDFLNSAEDYQYEKDYSHLGNITFRLKKDGREREAHFNYTTNKNAMALGDEYRRISNQIIWMFDMNVARENQPLDAPRQMDALQSYMSRNEISDPQQLVPFLQGLTNDERIPLIARNHAGKMIKQIEKEKK